MSANFIITTPGYNPWPGRLYTWRDRPWRVIARAVPFDRGPRRSVLIECVLSGERVVRPFRGLRRVT